MGSEAFGEPAVDLSEKVARLLPLALIAPQLRHADRRAQFPGFCLLSTCNCEGLLELPSRFRRVRPARPQLDFAGHAVDICFVPPFLRGFHGCYSFAGAAPSLLELADLGMGFCRYDSCKGL